MPLCVEPSWQHTQTLRVYDRKPTESPPSGLYSSQKFAPSFEGNFSVFLDDLTNLKLGSAFCPQLRTVPSVKAQVKI